MDLHRQATVHALKYVDTDVMIEQSVYFTEVILAMSLWYRPPVCFIIGFDIGYCHVVMPGQSFILSGMKRTDLLIDVVLPNEPIFTEMAVATVVLYQNEK